MRTPYTCWLKSTFRTNWNVRKLKKELKETKQFLNLLENWKWKKLKKNEKKYDSGGIRTHALNGLEPKPSALDLSATLPFKSRTGDGSVRHAIYITHETASSSYSPSTRLSTVEVGTAELWQNTHLKPKRKMKRTHFDKIEFHFPFTRNNNESFYLVILSLSFNNIKMRYLCCLLLLNSKYF